MKPLLLLCLFLSVWKGYSQTNTIFKDKVCKVSGYGELLTSFTSVNKNFVNVLGGIGAVLINDRWIAGGYGFGITNGIPFQDASISDKVCKLKYGNGGLVAGYIFTPKEVVHLSVSTMVGMGKIKIADNTDVLVEDRIFTITPTAELEVNIANFFRIGFGVDYRCVFGVNCIKNYSAADFMHPGAFLDFKFGWFK